jgi:hypothetical protein
VAEEPTQEEIQEALGRIRIGDLLVQTVYTLSQLAYQRLSAAAPDLGQARLGIDAIAALLPVLDVPDQTRRDLEQMVTNLKLSYAKAAASASSAPSTGSEPAAGPEPEPDGGG